MDKGEIQFSGIVFFSGMRQLPGDILLSLEKIRKWAVEQGYVTEPEFQLLLDERISSLKDYFGSEDKLLVALSIHSSDSGPSYLEFPYVSVRTLMRRTQEIEIYYWRMIPNRWDSHGNVISYGETKFGFMLSGCSEEICSAATSKLVVEKFQSLFLDLSSEFEVEEFDDGSREIMVNGEVLATFAKKGRSFDISLSRKRD